METVIQVLNKNTGEIWDLSEVEFRAIHVNNILTHDQKMEMQAGEVEDDK